MSKIPATILSPTGKKMVLQAPKTRTVAPVERKLCIRQFRLLYDTEEVARRVLVEAYIHVTHAVGVRWAEALSRTELHSDESIIRAWMMWSHALLVSDLQKGLRNGDFTARMLVMKTQLVVRYALEDEERHYRNFLV